MCAKIISAVKSCVGEELSAVDLELKNSRRIWSVKSCLYVYGLTTLRGQEPPTVPEAGQIPEHPLQQPLVCERAPYFCQSVYDRHQHTTSFYLRMDSLDEDDVTAALLLMQQQQASRNSIRGQL